MLYDPYKEIEVFKTYDAFKARLKDLYIIEDYLQSDKIYTNFKNELMKLVQAAIRNFKQLTTKVQFKFYRSDEAVYSMELRDFLVNVMTWHPLVEIDPRNHILDENSILHAEQVPSICDFIYDVDIVPMRAHRVQKEQIDVRLGNLMYDYLNISLHFSTNMGLHYSDHTFFEMYDKYHDMIDYEFEEGMQASDIEAILNKFEDELVNGLKKEKDNPFGVILRAGTGMKTKQLREFIIAEGLRPTLTGGKTVNYPISNPILIRGLNKPSYQYVDALGARKPLIVNSSDMGKIGYFVKNMNILVRTLTLSRDKHMCDSKHYVNYEVKSKNHLKLLVGKYMYDDALGDIRMINANDTKLVGKKIKVKSVLTCACGPNKYCPVCGGDIVNWNSDIQDGLCTMLTMEHTKEIEQNSLSTKHLLITDSIEVKFTDEFYKHFTLFGEEVRFLNNVDDVNELAIHIDPERIIKIEEFDEDSTYNTYLDGGMFEFVNMVTGEVVQVGIVNDQKLYINNEVISIFRENDGFLKLGEIDDDTPIFNVMIENMDRVRPYVEMLNLITTDSWKETLGVEDDIDAISQKFFDLLVSFRIPLNVTAVEITLNRLIGDPNDMNKHPDFSKNALPPYHFYTLQNKLSNNASPTIGLIHDNIKRQITDVNFTKRQEPSYMDDFFKEKVCTDIIYEHRDRLNKVDGIEEDDD